MRIASLGELPERPEPIFDNTADPGRDFSQVWSLNGPRIFHEETTFLKRPLKLSFLPPITADTRRLLVNEKIAKVSINNIVLGLNNIGMKVEGIRVQILEHVFGVLYGMGIDTDILLESATPFGCISLPTKANCVQDYVDQFSSEVLELVKQPGKTFTVMEPTRIDFGGKRGSYIILLPDKGANELIFDLMVAYPGQSIGTQRICCKITEEMMRGYIAGARTPSYGTRRMWMHLLDRFPVLQNVVNIDSRRTFSFDKNTISDPRGQYMRNGQNMELGMHEILDKLGAYGIPISSFPGRFVGTIMVFASSHGQDLAVKRAMEMGRIPLKRV